jgi:hypothetical protein
MNQAAPQNPNEAWRNFTVASPIAACKLGRSDLKRLYRLVNEKQIEHRDRLTARLFKTDTETNEQFQERVTQVRNAFITTVRITGVNGEVTTGHGEDFFDSPLLPERILSIYYDTSFGPTAILKYTPSDRASILLDFSQPRPVDMAAQPSAPTPNNSNFLVTAETESWSTSLTTRIRDFFAEKTTHVGWLHASATYDALLMILGVPLALWGGYRLAEVFVGGKNWPPPVIFGIYIYAFLFVLNLFRSVFMYARWIYPKIELVGLDASRMLASGIWDAVKALADL